LRTLQAISPLLPPKPPHPKGGRPWIKDRAVLGGIIYVLRAGVPWRLLLEQRATIELAAAGRAVLQTMFASLGVGALGPSWSGCSPCSSEVGTSRLEARHRL
jgi:hypothetical protein